MHLKSFLKPKSIPKVCLSTSPSNPFLSLKCETIKLFKWIQTRVTKSTNRPQYIKHINHGMCRCIPKYTHIYNFVGYTPSFFKWRRSSSSFASHKIYVKLNCLISINKKSHDKHKEKILNHD